MAMQKSEDLANAVAIIFEELDKLNMGMLRCGIGIGNKETRSVKVWAATTDKNIPVQISGDESMDSHPLLQGGLDAWLKQEDYSYVLEGEDLTNYYKTQVSSNFILPDSQSLVIRNEGLRQYYFLATFQAGGIFAFRETPFPDEAKKVMKRFADVFNLTYTRFNDLKQAEAQRREAQIELALERVRARTMAMQKSDELPEAANVLFQQAKALSLPILTCGYNIWDKEDKICTAWMSSEDGFIQPSFRIPLTESPTFIRFYDSRQKGETFYVEEVSGEALAAHYSYMLTLPVFKEIINGFSKAGFTLPTFQIHNVANFSQGNLIFITYKPVPEAEDLFKRFAKVFEQTYTRFLDLQKAEARAREATIEAALEKVRSRSLAMHKSDEIKVVVVTVVEKIKELNIEMNGGVSLVTFSPGSKDLLHWLWIPDQLNDVFKAYLPYFDHIIFKDCDDAREQGLELIAKVYSGEDKRTYFNHLFHNTDFSAGPEEVKVWVMEQPYFGFSFAIQKHSGIFLNDYTGKLFSKDTNDILIRFSKVFEQAYVRFLDLQKAEAQAREATIEAALERVRGKAMSMHSSRDLADTINVFYHEMEALSVTPRRCGVGLMNKETHDVELSTMNTTEQGESIEIIGKLILAGHPVLEGIYDNWILQKEYHPVLRGNEIKKYYQLIRPQIGYPDYPTDTAQYGYFFFFNEGGVYAWTEKELSEDELKIYRRFTSVLSLTYKRYKDLKDTEANAREAIKRASLDRVRAEIASMRTTGDLERITPLIWNELTTLGVPFIRCGVFIMDEQNEQIHSFLSTPDGKAIAAFKLPYNDAGELSKVLAHWHKKEVYKDHWDEAAFAKWTSSLAERGAIVSEETYLTAQRPASLDLYFLPFLQGMLYVGMEISLSNEEIQLVQSLADAFSTAYARYEDFNKLESAKKQIEKTLVDLKQAQSQLIQSEKMASLGELTAGIAHEIQNPLNFVNNFSEVNKEMIVEMKEEISKGNYDEAKIIADDIEANEEKINHHGKRADAIVKGMLQHSRSSTGQKEPTDINALADEFLRLAYHGLRAKDKSFNADIKTNFDDTIGKINIIPQDIGRVLLNVFNNAFYAVSERQKAESLKQNEQYTPLVSVQTKKINDKVEIKVTDNGNGIPENIVDKIFQPFFTTKPTGEGTGLGLSLAYDIIKAHGGELKVDTKEGEGSEFIIELLLNTAK